MVSLLYFVPSFSFFGLHNAFLFCAFLDITGHAPFPQSAVTGDVAIREEKGRKFYFLIHVGSGGGGRTSRSGRRQRRSGAAEQTITTSVGGRREEKSTTC